MELARCPFSSAGIPTAPGTATCGRRHTQIGPRGLGFQAFETFLAGAIQKAVRWTGCTKSQECAVKSSPRPMKPHAQIVCRDAQRFRHFAARLTEQIHLPDQLGILARHRWQYPVKATANGPLGIIVDFQHRTFRYLETLQRRFSYTCAPVVIGHRSPQHLGQPSLQGPLLFDRPCTADRFQIKVLQYVLGIMEVLRPSAHKTKELPMPISQSSDHRLFNGARRWRLALHATPVCGRRPRGIKAGIVLV